MEASDLARSLTSAFKSDLSRAASFFSAAARTDHPSRPH
jgi:hypothetical protein